MLTLSEYLEDYAPEETSFKGWKVIEKHIAEDLDESMAVAVGRRLERIKQGERDIYF